MISPSHISNLQDLSVPDLYAHVCVSSTRQPERFVSALSLIPERIALVRSLSGMQVPGRNLTSVLENFVAPFPLLPTLVAQPICRSVGLDRDRLGPFRTDARVNLLCLAQLRLWQRSRQLDDLVPLRACLSAPSSFTVAHTELTRPARSPPPSCLRTTPPGRGLRQTSSPAQV